MTVAELRERLLEYPQEALVVSFNEFTCKYEPITDRHIAEVGMSNEGLFSVPLVAI